MASQGRGDYQYKEIIFMFFDISKKIYDTFSLSWTKDVCV